MNIFQLRETGPEEYCYPSDTTDVAQLRVKIAKQRTDPVLIFGDCATVIVLFPLLLAVIVGYLILQGFKKLRR